MAITKTVAKAANISDAMCIIVNTDNHANNDTYICSGRQKEMCQIDMFGTQKI